MVVSTLRQFNIEFKENIQLKDYSNFKIGGLCKILILPKTEKEVQKTIEILKINNCKYMVLGKGANVLFLDKGYSGAIIKLGSNFSRITVNGDEVLAGAGASLVTLCKKALQYGLKGLEFCYGIPATIGGAVYMNAGAYGGEIKDVVTKVRYIDEKGEIKELLNSELNFCYRHSFFCDKNCVVISACFKLEKGEKKEIESKMKELFLKRTTKQPYYLPSAGSTFKRPVGTYAALLIEQCGLKGKKIGGAMVSDLHSGFIVNFDNATSKNVLDLISLVKKQVKEKTGYSLECEIKIIE